MFDYFEPGKDYTADSFKIVNQNYLFVCKKKKRFQKRNTHMKTFICILERKLNENIYFKSFISR